MHLFVLVHVDALQLAEANQVGAHQDPQLLSLLLPLLSVPAVALVLHPHPQLVHFSKVQENKVDGVVDFAGHFLSAPVGDRQLCAQYAQTFKSQTRKNMLRVECLLHNSRFK